MKKNKIVAFAMAGALLVGGTFAGTKAWLSDKATEKSDLVITTGNIDVETTVRDEWTPGYLEYKEGAGIVAIRDNTTEAESDGNGGFKNVRPGDKFFKTIEIRNTGTLTQKLNVSGGEDKYKNDSFRITTTAKQDIGNSTILKPGMGNGFFIEVEVLEQTENGKQSTEFNLEDSMEPIVITADQINKVDK
ncbi:MAG: hypothetical protein ACRCVJ_05460 [Clostridium sp.]|uniref:hypothetical protein n=1 Tax=Clostridium sp. TaxID=1506 RepID=UPI003F2FAB4B